MFRFANPEYLYWLFLVPVVGMIYLYFHVKTRKRVKVFGDWNLLRSLIPNYSPIRVHVKFVLMLVALSLMVLMLARPQFGTRIVEDSKDGIEVAVLLDVSNSMYANDVNPNRLERAKLLLSKMIDEMENDKLALGIFAGEAYPQLPMTNDYISAKMMLESISPEMVSYQGTNFSAALQLAQHSFTENKEVGKAVIIITDGEDHEGGALDVAKELGKAGMHLYVLGIGTAGGSAIPLASGGVLLDSSGEPVRTALNEDFCKEIASAAKGTYLHVDETNRAQEMLLAELHKLQRKENVSQFTEPNEQFVALAILILFVLVVEFFMFETKSPLFRNIKLFKK